MNIQITDIEIVLFFKDILTKKAERLSLDIDEKVEQAFVDSTTIITPNSQNAPVEFPIFTKKSNDNKFELTITKEKCSLFYHAPMVDRNKTYIEIKDSIMITISALVSYLTNSESAIQIIRLGYIVHYFIENNQPDQLLRKRFLPADLQSVEGTFLQFNEKATIEGFKLNQIYTIAAGELNDSHEKGIVIRKDINTDKDTEYNLKKEELSNFVEITSEKFQKDNIEVLLKEND